MIDFIILTSAALFCTMVAGFLFAFAVVVMPGIKNLQNREFIHTFQVIDGVIQKSQPVFMLLWLGSVLLLISAVIVGIGRFENMQLMLLLTSAIIYLFGVQLPTIVINIPLNNKLQAINAQTANETDLKMIRDSFEARWNRWNRIRTYLACLSSALLIILLFLV
jgi:uncharacterized membrane protein